MSPQTMMQNAPRETMYPTSMTIPLDIVGGNGFGRYPKISTEQTYNMVISDGALVDFAGYELVENLNANGFGRNIYNSVLLNALVAVVGNGLYIITISGETFSPSAVSQLVGNLETSEGPVFIADNLANQICLVDGINIYVYNYVSDTFTVISGSSISAGFAPAYISYQDTYFIVADSGSNKWYLSAPSDGTTWSTSAANVGTFETKPAKMVATVALDRILLVMSQTGTEPWYDVGYQLFPYQRQNAYAIDYGCINAQSIAVGYGMIVWIGVNERSGLALMVSQEGNIPQQISNDGLDFIFSQLNNPQACYGFLFKLEGHIFYQFTFYNDNYTYLYDFNTQQFFTLTDEKLNYHIARNVAFINNAYYFVSFNDGNLYRMSSLITNYNGNEIPRIRICKNIRFPGADRFVIQNVNIIQESGINQGITRVHFSISADGGYSYRNVAYQDGQLWGRRMNTFNLYNLGGYSNDVVIKFRFSSKGRFVIIGGQISLYR